MYKLYRRCKITKNLIVQASTLPLSIIIVGVGNADFENMNILDNDDGSMRDDKGTGVIRCLGRTAQRDLVQFVPFNEFKGKPDLLAKNVLQELPDQLVDYMVLQRIKPVTPATIVEDRTSWRRPN
jgi:hypothetical protein